MSKKNFSDGIDSLFNNIEEKPQEEMQASTEAGVEVEAKKRTSSRKNFITDLDFLLQEALDDIDTGKQDYGYASSGRPSGKQAAPGKSKSQSADKPTGHRAPVSGLDALIRQTVKFEENTDNDTKRFTVVVDKEMLKKLKTIARMENQFLKDIMTELIDQYIQEYTDKKGVDI